MNKLVYALLTLLWVYGPAVCAQAPLQTTTVYAQDFEGAPLGPVDHLSGGVHDNTYAGGATPLRVVDSGDPGRGKVLEVQAHGFAQIVLGELSLRKDKLYRVSLDINSRGAQRPTFMLRLIPWPYNGYIASQEQTGETWRRISFLGKAPADAASVGLFLNVNSFTTLQIDNIKIEEVSGDLPPGDPPIAGNLLPNAGFEVGHDGWYTRGDIKFVATPQAFEGHRAVAFPGGPVILSSTWMRLSFSSDYLVQVRVKAVGNTAFVRAELAGKEIGLTVNKADGWKTLAFRVRPGVPAGKIVQSLDRALTIYSQDKALIDAVSVQAAPAELADDAPFRPKATLEIALSTDVAIGVATVGEPVTVRLLSSLPIGAVLLQVRDESGALVRQMPVRFAKGQAQVHLSRLPPGYWHLITRPPVGAATRNRIEGETFLAVVPAMPDLAVKNWFYGTHIIDLSAMRQACWKLGLRWDRQHDTSSMTKWPTVQPTRGQWNFSDTETARRRTEGQFLLGSLDSFPDWLPKAPPVEGNDARMFAQKLDVDAALPLWQEYAQRSARHWKGQIDHWEIVNEPNLWFAPPDLYLRFLQSAYAGVKAGNPQARIVAPALGGTLDDLWLNDLIDRGGSRYFDVLTYHGYGLTTWSSLAGPQALRESVERMRARLARAGTPKVEIWDGETGLSGIQSSFTKFYLPGWDVDALDAARMYPKSAACAEAAGLDRILYYAAFAHTVSSENESFGFADINGVLLEPFQPLAVAISQLEGRQFVRENMSQPGVIDLAYAGRGATVRVLWRTVGTSSMSVPKGARVLSMWGRDMNLSGGKIALTQNPVYFMTR